MNWKKRSNVLFNNNLAVLTSINLILIPFSYSLFLLNPFQFEKLGHNKPWIHVPVFLVYIAGKIVKYLRAGLPLPSLSRGQCGAMQHSLQCQRSPWLGAEGGPQPRRQGGGRGRMPVGLLAQCSSGGCCPPAHSVQQW